MLAGFIGELIDDETPFLFNVIPIEILGSVYERFLGAIVRAHCKGITVGQTVGRQLDAIAGGENDASATGRRASGSEGASPAVPGAPAGNTGDAPGKAGDRPGAARIAGMSSARARTTAGGAPALPVSYVLPRLV